jgi:poly(3-hydroxybutyrate) depolymerase
VSLDDGPTDDMKTTTRTTWGSMAMAMAMGAVALVAFAFPELRDADAQTATSASVVGSAPALPSIVPRVGAAAKSGDPQSIENPGYPNAYFFKPRSAKSMKPVIVYLHGRGGVPDEGCRAWAKVATEFGWLLCPSGQDDRGHGQRGWNNERENSTKNVMGALTSLRKKFGRKVQLYGNVLIGFSEGAYVAENIGPRDPKTFNRWLIVASCDRYFGAATADIHAKKKQIKRVYLWTGELDGAEKESEQTFEHLKSEGIQVKLTVPKGLPHAIPADTMTQHFRAPIKWLVSAK